MHILGISVCTVFQKKTLHHPKNPAKEGRILQRKVDIGNGKHVKLKIFIEKQPHSLIDEGWQWQVFVGHRSDHALAMLI